MDSNTESGNSTRPSVLDNASDTQILDLQRQFEEGHREEWDHLTTGYGWSQEESEAVWQWFQQRPQPQ